MSDLLIISTSSSDFHMLKTLSMELSKSQKVDFLCFFKPNEIDIEELKNHKINLKVENLNLSDKSDNTKSITKDLQKIQNKFGQILIKSNHKVFVVLGDRYELLPVVQQIYLKKRIIIHLHGGEITQDSWDDSIRHSISKLSHIHFVASSQAKKVLIKMGEQSNNIFNYGSLGAQNTKKLTIIEKDEIFKLLETKPELKTCLLVLQPMTNTSFDTNKNLDTIVNFLVENKFNQLLVSNVNSDPGGKDIRNYFSTHVNKKISYKFLETLGAQKYISLAKHSDLVIGNSSSFIFELPVKNIKSILITNRQKGRNLSPHVFPAQISKKSLNNSYMKLQQSNTVASSQYYKSNTAANISNKINEKLANPPEFRKVFRYEK